MRNMKPFFYDYILYKLYSWAKKRDNTPVATVVITLAVVHLFQFSTLINIIFYLTDFNFIRYFYEVDKILFLVFLIIWGAINYKVLYNQQKWDDLLIRFKNENPKNSRTGSIYVLLYLISSVLIFFLSLPLLSPSQ